MRKIFGEQQTECDADQGNFGAHSQYTVLQGSVKPSGFQVVSGPQLV
jgi:hypothetical protein